MFKIKNIFSGLQSKKVPESIDECMKVDPITANLWLWCERLETLGKALFWILLVVGVIASFAVSTDFEELMRYGLEDAFNGSMLFESLFQTALYAFLEYCAYHIIALLVGALASIVQNTKVSADLALYASSQDSNYHAPEEAPEGEEADEGNNIQYIM